MPPISVLMKPSSGMCNMKCDYCFYCDETQKRIQESYGFMSEQTLKNVIRKTMLRAEGAVSYAFQGGEPTLRGIDFFEKVVEFEKQYNKHGIRVNNALQTNGYLINEAWCEFFQKNHFLIGLSVDGTKEIHDSYRHTKDGTCGVQNVVEADGSVYPCDFYMLDDYKLGNFNENRLDEIDTKRTEIGFVERSLLLDEECKVCEYFHICHGGCQRNRDLNELTGKYQNYFCESYKMFFAACLPRMKETVKTLEKR